MSALSDCRPIRPKPLIPTRVAMVRDLLGGTHVRLRGPGASEWTFSRTTRSDGGRERVPRVHPDRASLSSYQRGPLGPWPSVRAAWPGVAAPPGHGRTPAVGG